MHKKPSTFGQLSDMNGFVDGKGQAESYTQNMEGRMSKNSKSQCKIKGVKPTDEKITGRGGLSLFARYIEQIGLIPLMLIPMFGGLRKSNKGASVKELFKQILCNFMDGTCRHLSYYDHLQKDKAYAATIGSKHEDLASSHTVKRFFQAFSWPMIWSFRYIFLAFFIWRLQVTQPKIIVLDLDAMVMDNDQAQKREGANPTYKKCKGFNALQLTWNGFLVDSAFRSGEKHSNSGQSVQRMLRRAIKRIRSSYNQDVPIIIHMDSGFMDQKVFEELERLQVGYICGGKLYGEITKLMATIPPKEWKKYFGPGPVENNRIWEYVEFGDRRDSWSKFRRAIFTRPMSEDGRMLLPFVRPCQMIYSNIGQGFAIDDQLRHAGYESLLKPEGIIQCYHDRGRSELTFRSFKDFGSEQLPFKRFKHNAAYYNCMALAYNLCEAFKEDVCGDIIPITSYPETLRRKIIDVGAKLIKDSREYILKIPEAIYSALNFEKLWEKCNTPPRFALL